ncbi:MAG: hypothetical protein WCF10_18975, partial [Polyangiales bacterium]
TDAPVEYSFPLDFLDAGVAYELALIEQGPTPSAFERTVLSVIAGDPFVITVPPRGGFVAILSPK